MRSWPSAPARRRSRSRSRLVGVQAGDPVVGADLRVPSAGRRRASRRRNGARLRRCRGLRPRRRGARRHSGCGDRVPPVRRAHVRSPSLGCPVIEDCAHALLPASEADVSIYSFHTTKLLATGEGGAVVARTDAAAHAAARPAPRLRREQAASWRAASCRCSDLGASLGLAQLERREAFERRRRELAARLRRAAQLACSSWSPHESDQVPFRWIAQTRTPSFEPLREALQARGVADPPSGRPAPAPRARPRRRPFPVAERLYAAHRLAAALPIVDRGAGAPRRSGDREVLA